MNSLITVVNTSKIWSKNKLSLLVLFNIKPLMQTLIDAAVVILRMSPKIVQNVDLIDNGILLQISKVNEISRKITHFFYYFNFQI